MAGHRAGGGEQVSVGCIIVTVHFSCECVAKSFFDSQEALTAGRMPIFQALLPAYNQWESMSFPRPTHRGGVPADIIQAIWENAMQSEDRVVIRDAAAVILAYVLGLRESSVMSLLAENITHIEAKMTVVMRC
jgi:integrase